MSSLGQVHDCFDYVGGFIRALKNNMPYTMVPDQGNVYLQDVNGPLESCKNCRILCSIYLNGYLVKLLGAVHQRKPLDYVGISSLHFIQILFSSLFTLLSHEDIALYWISDTFTSDKTKYAIISLISYGLRHVYVVLKYMKLGGTGKKLEKWNEIIITTAESIASFVMKLLLYRKRIRRSTIWFRIRNSDAVNSNFDDGVNNLRLIAHIIRRKVQQGIPLDAHNAELILAVIQSYNELFINLWYKDDTSKLLIYLEDWDVGNHESFINKLMATVPQETHSIKWQWKYCDNEYYMDEGMAKKLKKCENCKYSRYCSSRCQKLDWNRGLHKLICNLMHLGV